MMLRNKQARAHAVMLVRPRRQKRAAGVKELPLASLFVNVGVGLIIT